MITIELNSLNLQKAEEKIIKQAIIENSEKTYKEISEILGISERTLYRKVKDFNIEAFNEKNEK